MEEKKKLRIQDLAKIRDGARSPAAIREGQGRAKVTVHRGTCWIAAGAREPATECALAAGSETLS